MPARISREYLPDESLDRAIRVLLMQMTTLGSLIHRYSDAPEVEYEVRKDDNAVSDVLGILLVEQRQRRIEDEVDRTTITENQE